MKTKKSEVSSIDTLDGNLPPSNKDMEYVVLGSILIQNEIIHSCIQDLSSHIFFNDECQKTCELIIELYRESKGIDIMTVYEKARAHNVSDIVTPTFLSQLTSKISSTANFDNHFKILQEYALKRSLIQVSGKSLRAAFDGTNDVFDLYAEAQGDLESALKSIIHYEIKKVDEIHNDIIRESIELTISGKKSGVPSGLIMVDNLTNGWQDSDLIILAGRPSMGKTAAAISMSMYPALREDIPIGIFSLEMSDSQLVSRMQSFLSGVNVGRIVKKQLSVQDIEQIEGLAKELNKAPIYIDDTPNISLLDLKGKARKMVKEHGVRLIIIDYLQLMRSGYKTQSREQEVAEISKGLKIIAKELKVPVIALSQLSRNVENRGGDKKPQLSDLRESGQLEQDADMVMFCYRPEYYGIDDYEIDGETFQTDGLFMLLISKHRNGELGEIPLKFIHEQTKLTNHNFSNSNIDNSQLNSTFVQQEDSSNVDANMTDFLKPRPEEEGLFENDDKDDELPF